MKVSYSNKLYEVRTERGYSIRRLSQLTGISKSHIAKIEAYESIPSICIAYTLARALDVEVDYLFRC